MSHVPGSGRLDRWSKQWKVVSLMMIGAIGVFGCAVQVGLNPLIGRPISATACQYSLVMVLGIPLGKLLQHSQRAE